MPPAGKLLNTAEDLDELQRGPVPQAPFLRALVTLGLRFHEIASARWCDYDEEARVLRLRAAMTKTRRSREVPVPRAMAEEWTALRARRALAAARPMGPGDLIFTTPEGAAWDGANARRLLKKAREGAGIPKADALGRTVDVHALRATAATRLLRHGVSAPIAAEILGHRDVKTTLRHYSDLRVEDMRAALDGLPAPPVPKKDAPLRAVVGGANPGAIPESPNSDATGPSRYALEISEDPEVLEDSGDRI